MQYVKFTEINEWEGETWHFYLPLEANKVSLQRLHTLLQKGDSSTYILDLTPLTQEFVDYVVAHQDDDDCGYMYRHNKVNGTLILPATIDLDVSDPFYKGGIKDVFE